MAMDIRLDFISDIDPIEIERMKEVRAKIIEIDDELKKIIAHIIIYSFIRLSDWSEYWRIHNEGQIRP